MRLHPRQALLYAKRLMSDQSHWDRVYETKAATDVSWFSPHLEQSLSIIERICPAQTAQIIDVGCGQSSLGSQFTLLETTELSHVTPSGTIQNFIYFVLQKSPH